MFDGFVSDIGTLQELSGHPQEGLLRPLVKPIDGAIVDQGWEHANSLAESLPDGAHGKDNMQILCFGYRFASTRVKRTKGEPVKCSWRQRKTTAAGAQSPRGQAR